MVASTVPNAIVCLLTALRMPHEIGTQSPHEVWIAVDRKARKPTRLPTRVRIVRFSGAMLSYGVVTQPILGVPVQVTSPARPDRRRLLPLSKQNRPRRSAIQALRDAVRSRKATVDEIVRAAEVCHARTVLRPYLDALAP